MVKRQERRLNEFLLIFLTTSSLHGLQHIAAKGRHPVERLSWFIWTMGAVFGAGWLSFSTWTRYQISPTVVSLERNFLEWNTTVPAVTICPKSKINTTNLADIASKAYSKNANETLTYLSELSGWAYPELGELPEDVTGMKSEKYLSLLTRAKYNFTGSVPEELKLKPLVHVITELGQCYVFNSNVATYANPTYWFANNWTIAKTEPLLHGSPLDEDIVAHVTDINSPYQVYVHDPQENIDASSTLQVQGELTYLTSMYISLLTAYSTEATRSLSVKQRKCRFMEESNLETSPVYTYNMCRSECRMRLAHRLCACIPYFYRKTGAYNICGSTGMNCLNKHKERLRTLRIGNKKERCKCYPTCVSIRIQSLVYRHFKWDNDTILRMSLENYPKFRLKRDIVFSFGDLLAQMGGAAGLCLGCSVLSVFEIFYLLTFRLFFYKKRDQKKKKEVVNRSFVKRTYY